MMNSTSHPRVSIGIPTYNRAAGNLRSVIERALGQTFQDIEVIVSDNCSTDHTPELLKSFDDPRLHYFRQETNIGPNNNFNFCLEQAKGEYFLLFHDDDMIDEDFVETCISSLAPEESVGVIITGNRIIDGQDNVREEHRNNAAGLSALDFILGWFKDTTTLYLCSTLYNTARLKEAGGFSSKKNIYNDLIPTFTLATKYGRRDVAEAKASFRKYLNNRGSSIPIGDWVEESLYLLDVLYRLLPDENRLLRDAGELYFCRKMYWYLSCGSVLSKSPIDYLHIYRAYHYCYSPLRYLYERKLQQKVGRIGRVFALR